MVALPTAVLACGSPAEPDPPRAVLDVDPLVTVIPIEGTDTARVRIRFALTNEGTKTILIHSCGPTLVPGLEWQGPEGWTPVPWGVDSWICPGSAVITTGTVHRDSLEIRVPESTLPGHFRLAWDLFAPDPFTLPSARFTIHAP
jgi:hypothetical protein